MTSLTTSIKNAGKTYNVIASVIVAGTIRAFQFRTNHRGFAAACETEAKLQRSAKNVTDDVVLAGLRCSSRWMAI